MKVEPASDVLRQEHLDSPAVGILLLCCALWGLQQVAVKAILDEAAPLFQGTVRSAGAALLLWIWSAWRGVPLWRRDGTLGAGVLAGVLFGGEFACIYLALPHTQASRLIVFLYLAPFVVAATLPRFVPNERLGGLQMAGLIGAFAALAYAFQEGFALPHSQQWLGDSLAILAAVLWGLTTLVVRTTRLALATPEKTLFYQLAVSAVLLGVGSALTGESWSTELSWLAWESLAFQTIVVAFASYLMWFWLLRHFSATKVSAFSFLTPVFGLFFGSVLLHERLTARILVALLCIATGIYLVNRKSLPSER
jgi:drug/metabolite transporter (DMT)-like permease